MELSPLLSGVLGTWTARIPEKVLPGFSPGDPSKRSGSAAKCRIATVLRTIMRHPPPATFRTAVVPPAWNARGQQ
jgi:hypothetical protein